MHSLSFWQFKVIASWVCIQIFPTPHSSIISDIIAAFSIAHSIYCFFTILLMGYNAIWNFSVYFFTVFTSKTSQSKYIFFASFIHNNSRFGISHSHYFSTIRTINFSRRFYSVILFLKTNSYSFCIIINKSSHQKRACSPDSYHSFFLPFIASTIV